MGTTKRKQNDYFTTKAQNKNMELQAKLRGECGLITKEQQYSLRKLGERKWDLKDTIPCIEANTGTIDLYLHLRQENLAKQEARAKLGLRKYQQTVIENQLREFKAQKLTNGTILSQYQFFVHKLANQNTPIVPQFPLKPPKPKQTRISKIHTSQMVTEMMNDFRVMFPSDRRLIRQNTKFPKMKTKLYLETA